MKKNQAFTLMEMLVVMSVMIILLGMGLAAYIAFIETTKFNQDVADIQNDVLTMQRAAMLFKKDKDDGWAYGLGIDFDGLIGVDRDGTYKFFKWCSGFSTYDAGDIQTSGPYPNYNGSDDSGGIDINPSYDRNYCEVGGLIDTALGQVVTLSGYSSGRLNYGSEVTIEPVSISGIDYFPRFLVFESVTGRAFIYDTDGNLIKNDEGDLVIIFEKNIGTDQAITIDNITGNTKLSVYNP